MSHSFAGVRGLKYIGSAGSIPARQVALLRGGAWIEMILRVLIKARNKSHSFAGVRGLKSSRG